MIIDDISAGFKTLDVPLRGTRDYLQSADVYSKLLASLEAQLGQGSIASLQVKFSAINRRLPQYRIHDVTSHHKPTPRNTIVASFALHDGDTRQIEIVEGDRRPSEALSDNETEIAKFIEVFDEYSQLKPTVDATISEQVVFASKTFHYSKFPTETAKWMVVELNINLELASQDWELMTIRLDMQRNEAVTKSSIYVDGANIGFVRYMKIEYSPEK